MSDPDHDAHTPQQPDRLPMALLLAVAIGTITLSMVLSAVALALVDVGPGDHVPIPAPQPPALERAPIEGAVFDTVEPAAQQRERARLHRWGWVDRSRGLVHMPIDLAMDEEIAATEDER